MANWCRRATWTKAFSPTTGCIGERLIRLCASTSSETARTFFRLKRSAANLVCSRVSNWKVSVIPARSPIPLQLAECHWTPAWIAARVLPRARPRSLCTWYSKTTSGNSWRSSESTSKVSSGSRMPTLSAKQMRSAPASRAVAIMLTRSLTEVRAASSTVARTRRPRSRA